MVTAECSQPREVLFHCSVVTEVEVLAGQLARPFRVAGQRPGAAGSDDVRLGDELAEPCRTCPAGVPGEVGEAIRIPGDRGGGGAAE
jgi:hypothetical protein